MYSVDCEQNSSSPSRSEAVDQKKAAIFSVSKSLVQKLVKQQKIEGIYSRNPGNRDTVI
jgi:hypothetical protein